MKTELKCLLLGVAIGVLGYNYMRYVKTERERLNRRIKHARQAMQDEEDLEMLDEDIFYED